MPPDSAVATTADSKLNPKIPLQPSHVPFEQSTLLNPVLSSCFANDRASFFLRRWGGRAVKFRLELGGGAVKIRHRTIFILWWAASRLFVASGDGAQNTQRDLLGVGNGMIAMVGVVSLLNLAHSGQT